MNYNNVSKSEELELKNTPELRDKKCYPLAYQLNYDDRLRYLENKHRVAGIHLKKDLDQLQLKLRRGKIPQILKKLLPDFFNTERFLIKINLNDLIIFDRTFMIQHKFKLVVNLKSINFKLNGSGVHKDKKALYNSNDLKNHLSTHIYPEFVKINQLNSLKRDFFDEAKELNIKIMALEKVSLIKKIEEYDSRINNPIEFCQFKEYREYLISNGYKVLSEYNIRSCDGKFVNCKLTLEDLVSKNIIGFGGGELTIYIDGKTLTLQMISKSELYINLWERFETVNEKFNLESTFKIKLLNNYKNKI